MLVIGTRGCGSAIFDAVKEGIARSENARSVARK
jgi:hypothetical protein